MGECAGGGVRGGKRGHSVPPQGRWRAITARSLISGRLNGPLIHRGGDGRRQLVGFSAPRGSGAVAASDDISA